MRAFLSGVFVAGWLAALFPNLREPAIRCACSTLFTRWFALAAGCSSARDAPPQHDIVHVPRVDNF